MTRRQAIGRGGLTIMVVSWAAVSYMLSPRFLLLQVLVFSIVALGSILTIWATEP